MVDGRGRHRQRGRAVPCRDPGPVVQVLVRGGQAPQRPGGRDERPEPFRPLTRGVGGDGDERPEGRVEPIDPVEVVLGHLERGRVPPADPVPEFLCGEVVEFEHGPRA
ncbi:hypothetical protein Cus16_0136 [Curtobacterium sp. ER1/6]|nr:hypothetical protein Cus16_0136 [Curtobacterium sp. ER1/6]